MKDFWVDSKTLRYLNKFRDNVFVSQIYTTNESGSNPSDDEKKQKPTRLQP